MMSSHFSCESFLFWQVEKRILLDIKKDEHVASMQFFVGLIGRAQCVGRGGLTCIFHRYALLCVPSLRSCRPPRQRR